MTDTASPLSLKSIKKETKRDQFDRISSIVWLIFSILAFAVLVLKLVVFQQVNVVGQSMEPNYFGGQKLLLNKLDTDLHRGQVVSVYEFSQMAADANFVTRAFPTLSKDNPRFLLKRVIGLPGEEIEILGSKVIIYNAVYPAGVIISEDYLASTVKDAMDNGCGRAADYFARKKIEANHYFVMGDNRCESLDSRDTAHGAYDKSLLFGQVVARYWPLEQRTFFQLPEYRYDSIDSLIRAQLDKKTSYKESFIP
jgi:signal peptidase I